MSYYRLELLPTENGMPYYKTYEHNIRDNNNAGVDLYSAENYFNTFELKPVKLLDLGVKARLVKVSPSGEEDSHYWLCPRSSIYKSNIMMANSIGVIDSTYRGVLMAPIKCINNMEMVNIKEGTRLFQIVAPDMGHIKEIKIVKSLPDSVRGEGGFGSTGSS